MQVLNLGNAKPGETITITNGGKSASRYTFRCGEYGAISFTLIIGASFTFTVGDTIPIIEHDSADVT